VTAVVIVIWCDTGWQNYGVSTDCKSTVDTNWYI